MARICIVCDAREKAEKQERAKSYWQTRLSPEERKRRHREQRKAWYRRQRGLNVLACRLPECDERYVPESMHQKYCSQECSQEARRRRRRSAAYRLKTHSRHRRRLRELRGTQLAMEKLLPALITPRRPPMQWRARKPRRPKPVLMPLACMLCGDPIRRNAGRKFCSRECRDEAYACNPTGFSQCEICQRQLATRLQRFCSDACRYESHKRRLFPKPSPCERCGAPLSHRGARFCAKCREKAHSDERPPEHRAERKKRSLDAYVKMRGLNLLAQTIIGPLNDSK
jgi:hypothetical protein